MLKNDAPASAAAAAAAAASGPAKPKVDGKAAAALSMSVSAARATATSPSSNATSLRFGDRLVQAAQQQHHHHAQHHHVHEEALPLASARGGAVGLAAPAPGIERPAAVLLAEGPGFRFEAISQCEIPTDRGLFHLRAYRYTTTAQAATSPEGAATTTVVEPVVLFQGSHRGGTDVLVRVHDQCLTSEVLGSRRCDCKEQLELAMDRVAAAPEGGLIIYLPQEGRGIGLANKVAAYALQEQGLDTVDANLFLGFGDDERTYDYVPYILKDFGIESIRLATNNPFKTRSLRAAGVTVAGVEPLQAPANAHNHHYLRTKILKMEHSMDLPSPPHSLASSSAGGSTASSSSSMGNGATTPEEALTEASSSASASDAGEEEEEEEEERRLDGGEDVGLSLSGLLEEEERGPEEEGGNCGEAEARGGRPTARAEGEQEEADAASSQVAWEYEGAEPPRYAFGRETVEAAIRAIAEGKMVVVVDDEDRENEGDIIMAADAVTTDAMAFIVRHCSGVVCVSLEGPELDRLKLPPMIVDNEDPKCTAFTVSVDYKHGTSTGISAHDRALTLRALADANAVATDFTRPGHIFPLRYTPGGVMRRRGHTEAALDLSRLAGRRPVGVLCEICNDDGSMARLPELQAFCKQHGGMVLTSIADLVAYRYETEREKQQQQQQSRR